MILNDKKYSGTWRRMTALLVILAVLIPGMRALPAKADVIYEPEDDVFYAKHRSECHRADEAWEINARGGVRLMESPESDTVVYEFEEIGTRVWLYVIYDNPAGGSWGYTEYLKNSEWKRGWIPMNLLWKSYDHGMFIQDYADRISSKENTVPAVQKGDTQDVYFYTYPGSSEYFVQSLTKEALENDPINTSSEFTDEEGRKWGYIGYYYAMKGWICLDQPNRGFEALWPDGAPERDPRTRTYYEVAYGEDETQVAEISDPDAPASDAETGGSDPELPSGETDETIRPTEEARSPAESEESVKPSETREKPQETAGDPASGLSVKRNLWLLPAAIAAVSVISAAIVLIVIIRKKKK